MAMPLVQAALFSQICAGEMLFFREKRVITTKKMNTVGNKTTNAPIAGLQTYASAANTTLTSQIKKLNSNMPKENTGFTTFLNSLYHPTMEKQVRVCIDK